MPSDVPTADPQRPVEGGMLVTPRTQAAGDFSVPDFDEVVVWSGLTNPMVVEFAADGRAFVAEKSGIIKVFDNLDDATPTTYADLRVNVHNWWDRGLLGMALDPDFVDNGRMYVSYAYNAAIGASAPRWSGGSSPTLDNCPNPPHGTTDGCLISGRLSVLTNGGSEQVLINDWCQQFPSHSMGDVVIDAEGALIVSGGDGASFNGPDWGQLGGTLPNTTSPVVPRNPCGDPFNPAAPNQGQATGEGGALRSQDLRGAGSDPLGLSGSVIRVNRFTGNAMPDNPAAGASDPNERRIVAYGLRNPFRMALHPTSGELWVGDVGWTTWEEINRVDPDGGAVRNFGWPCREGASFEPGGYDETNLCQALTGVTAPHYAYQHGPAVGGECALTTSSISGLAFYAGGPYPDVYDNALFFTDYSRQCLWFLPATGPGGAPNPAQVTHFADLAHPVYLTVGPGGDLFYADFGNAAGTVPDGTIRRITYLFDNDVPTADLEADPTTGPDPLVVDFDASGSTDPNDDPLTYAWDFGDNDGQLNDAFEASPTHTYTAPGQYLARVRVSDGRGGTDTATVTIDVANDHPTATITSPLASLAWSVGQTISFSGTGTDPDEGTLPASAFAWDLLMHHCPDVCHTHPIESWTGVRNGSFVAPDHEYPSHLELRLTVTDALGAQDVTSIDLDPQTVTLRLRSNPTGLHLTVGGATATTPFDLTVIRGSAVVLGVPSGQTFDGFAYGWTAWSQGGPKTQTITANASATYTATFDGGFDDVPPGTKHAAGIAWLSNAGITSGCNATGSMFCPDGLVTRAQMATFLGRALNLPATSTDYFTDDAGSVHEPRINALRAAEITLGCSATRFCPDGLVTRAQMATFLGRALNLPATSTDYFTDDAGSVHEPRINALRAAEITLGCSATRFCPNGIVTRGQMAAFLQRALAEEPSN